MATTKQKITPCLWFDTEAEQAAKFYCSVFKDSKLGKISRYTEAGREVHHKPAGSVMVVEFEIEGQTFTALNGGPNFKFNEAISLQVRCEPHAEARLRCAESAGLESLDRSENDGTVVRPARVHHSRLRTRRVQGRKSADRDARTRRRRLPDERRVPFGNRAGAPGIHQHSDRQRWQASARGRDDRHLLRRGRQDHAYLADARRRPRSLRTEDARRHGGGLEPEHRQAAGIGHAQLNCKPEGRSCNPGQTSIHVIQASSIAMTHSATAPHRLRRASAASIAATVSGDSTSPSRVISST